MHYDNWSDYVAAATAPRTIRPNDASHRPEDGHKSFFGTATWDVAVKLARDGWPDGLRNLKSASVDLAREQNGLIMTTAYFYDVSGDIVDVGRYCAGDPDCMINYTTEVVLSPRVVKIFVPISACASITPQTLYNRGAAALATIDALEHSGTRVEVIIFMSNKSATSSSLITCTVKRAQDVLDLDVLAFTLCNASTFRRLSWSIKETWDAQTRKKLKIGAGYGMSIDYPKNLKEVGSIYIEQVNDNADVAEAWAHVRKALVQAGIDLKM